MKKVNWNLETINNNFVELSEDTQLSTDGGSGWLPSPWDVIWWLVDLGTIDVNAPTINKACW